MSYKRVVCIMLLATSGSAASIALPDVHDVTLKALSHVAGGNYLAVERVQVFIHGANKKAKAKTRRVEITSLAGGTLRKELRTRKNARHASLIYGRENGEHVLYWPAKRRLWRGAMVEERPEEELARLKAFYSLRISQGGRVSRRATWLVSMSAPGAKLRRSMWIDRETGEALKNESYRSDGRVLRRRKIVSKEGIDSEKAATLNINPDLKVRVSRWSDPVTAPLESKIKRTLLPGWLPEGFLLLSYGKDSAGGVVSSYSDGAAIFSLTERPKTASSATGARTVFHGGKTYLLREDGTATSVTWVSGDKEFIVAGDLPEDEMARVLNSLRLEL